MENKDNEGIYSTNGETIETQNKKEKHSKNQEVEKWLNAAYDFRFNEIKSKVEYRKKPTKGAAYLPMDKYTLLTIKRELDASGFSVSRDGLKDILECSFSTKINPVKDYFLNLFPWNEVDDHIQELADTVKCKNSEFWNLYLKKWLVAVVANVLNDNECKNHTMIVLTGGQGKFKTTWINNLCPKQLNPTYLYCGKPDIDNERKMNQLIAEFFLINLDDTLKEINKKNENMMKNYITTPFVTYDKKFDPYINSYPHLASFIGSVNGNEFLNDSTGSRRFLPFEVENINIKDAQNIDMDLVWSQAYKLYESGFVYWFNDKEVEELNKCNLAFAMISQEEELLSYYYSNKLPENTYSKMIHIPPAILLAELALKTKTPLSQKKLGEALNKLGFKKQQKGSEQISGWLVYKKTDDEIEKQKNT